MENKLNTLQTREEYDLLMRCAKQTDEWHIIRALEILEKRLHIAGELMGTPETVHKYLALKIGSLEHEVFGILFLDIRNKLITDEQMFRGTLNHISIYPREIMKQALAHNASAVIIYHNHPSGEAVPSPEDINLTTKLKAALKLIDVKILDHIIVAGVKAFSFSDEKLL